MFFFIFFSESTGKRIKNIKPAMFQTVYCKG